ncbi:hypothetical protein Tco_0854710 [Tanacetum coccineum]
MEVMVLPRVMLRPGYLEDVAEINSMDKAYYTPFASLIKSRKAHLLEDKQIPSVGVFHKVVETALKSLLTPSGSRNDGVTTFSDGVTVTAKEKSLEGNHRVGYHVDSRLDQPDAELREYLHAGTVLNEQTLGMILFNSKQRQDFISIEDFEELNNDLYNVQEMFFILHQGPGMNDLAKTFSSIFVVEVDKRNMNPNKQMRLIEQLRQ